MSKEAFFLNHSLLLFSVLFFVWHFLHIQKKTNVSSKLKQLSDIFNNNLQQYGDVFVVIVNSTL